MKLLSDSSDCFYFDDEDLKKVLNRSHKEFEAICLMDESIKIAIGMAAICEIIAAQFEHDNECVHQESLSHQTIANLSTFAGAVTNLLKSKAEDFSLNIKKQ